jgi:ubiquinone/menaquinone biosynthesis C-methylase UbiE
LTARDTRGVYRRVAPFYDILDLSFEQRRYQALRPLLFEGASGAVLDAGVGTGRNMAFYPPGSRAVGIDLSWPMLRRAARRRAQATADTALAAMDVCALAFADDSFDRIASSFLFCVLDADRQLPALKELARVCKPAGEIRVLEYALSEDPYRRFVMRLWTPWVRLVYGARFDRDTERYVPAAGLELIERRFLYRDVIKMLVLRPR